VANDLEASAAFTEVMRVLRPLSAIACASVLSKVARHYGYAIEEIVVNPPAVKAVEGDTDPDMSYAVALDQIDDKTPTMEPLSPNAEGQRGIDFPCEQCGALAGSTLDDGGWYRCHACGYPAK
jgi:hypothetical protein